MAEVNRKEQVLKEPITGWNRGRHPYKLTDQEVVTIFHTKDSQRNLAKKYNISERMVRLIKTRQLRKRRNSLIEIGKGDAVLPASPHHNRHRAT